MPIPTKQIAKRPFHETIVDAIRARSGPLSDEMFHLLELVEETEIPKGHRTSTSISLAPTNGSVGSVH